MWRSIHRSDLAATSAPTQATIAADAEFYDQIYPDRAAGNAPAAVMAGPDQA
jgi:hypothetical protein